MRAVPKILCCLLCVSIVGAFAVTGETVTERIRSESPFIIAHGHYIYPRDGCFEVTLTDSNVLVQGQIYEPCEKPRVPIPKPDRQKDFFDWAIRTPALNAQDLLDEGGTEEESRQLMADFYRQFEGSDTLSVQLQNDTYRLVYRGIEMYVPIPRKPRKPKPDYKKNVLEPEFKELCRHLADGHLIIKGDNYRQLIPADQLSPLLLNQLQDVPRRATKNVARDYEALDLEGKRGRITLLPSAVADLVKAGRQGR